MTTEQPPPSEATSTTPAGDQCQAPPGHGVGAVIRTLGTKGWEVQHIDRDLRDAICGALDVIGAEGVLAYVAKHDAHLSYATPKSGITPEQQRQILDEAMKRVRDRRDDLLAGQVAFFNYHKGYGEQRKEFCAAIASPTSATVEDVEQEPVDFCAFILRGDDVRLKPSTDKRSVIECRSVATVFFNAIWRRLFAFAHLPDDVSDRYWERFDRFTPNDDRIVPPWEIDDEVRTTTLVFDLRKSTFCMKEAIDSKKFAEWIDQLVQILTAVCHLHGGIFDKFTGDGILAHFLDKECGVVCQKRAVEASLGCAVDLLVALDNHLPYLLPNLHHVSDLLGGGVGIDVGPAYWAVDRKGNPITVGPGVVEAGRLCDTAKAKRIRITNAAYMAFQASPDGSGDAGPGTPGGVPEPEKVEFESKEYNRDMEVRVWEFDPPPAVLGSAPGKIAALCEKVRAESLQATRGARMSTTT